MDRFKISLAFLSSGWGFPAGSVVKNLPGNKGDPGSIPGSERSSEEGTSNPFQYSCLEKAMDRRVWWVQSMGSQKSRTRLSDSTVLTINRWLLVLLRRKG